MKVGKIAKNIFEFLLPQKCLICSAFGDIICEKCKNEKLEQVKRQVCHVCKQNLPNDTQFGVHEKCRKDTYLDGVLVCFHYDKKIERIIAEIKYNLYFSVSDFVGGEMTSLFNTFLLNKIDILVPIPLHNKKKWERGFNQTELFCKYIGKQLKVKSEELIVRKRNTKTQVGMTKKERVANLKEVFMLNPKFQLPNSKLNAVCLVDDVMTTGTTLEESAKVLRSIGIKYIYAIVFARG